MNPKVIIIILNWNGMKYTSECIYSLLNIEYDNFEILIVDNNSTEEDINKLKILLDNNKKVKAIFNKQNHGFAGGNNIGIDYSLNNGAEYIMILNNDTVVEKNFMKPLIEVFNNHKNVGIVAPQINYFDHPDIIWSAGGYISKIRGSGFALSNINEKKVKYLEKEVAFVSGCCMLIKKEVFEAIGNLDVQYFMYLEDVDFCLRASKAGFRIFVSHGSKIYHKVGKSTDNNLKPLPLYYVTRNRLLFLRKNYKDFFIIGFLYVLITMVLKSFIWFISGKKENLKPIIFAFRDFFKSRFGSINYKLFMI